MYQHNWAALVNTDAAFVVLKGDDKKEQVNNIQVWYYYTISMQWNY